jgi:hypothetical protein
MFASRSAFALVAVLSLWAPAWSQTTELAEVQAPGSPVDDLGHSVSLLGDRSVPIPSRSVAESLTVLLSPGFTTSLT